MIKIVGLTKEIASEKTIYFAQTYAVKLMFSLIWLLSVKATTSADISSSDNMLSLTTINGSKMSPIVMEQTSSGNATLTFNGRMHHKIDVLNLPNNRLLGDHSSYYFVNTGANKGGANFITLPTASSDGLFYNVRLTPGSEGLLYITSTSNINNEHGVVLDPSDSTNPNVSLMGVAGNWLTLDKNSVFPWQNVSNGNEIDGNYAYIDTGSASTASKVIYLPDNPEEDEVYKLTLSPQSAANLYVYYSQVFDGFYDLNNAEYQNGVVVEPDQSQTSELTFTAASGNWVLLSGSNGGLTNSANIVDAQREGWVSDNLIGWWKLNEILSSSQAQNLVLSGNNGIVDGNVQMKNDEVRGAVYDFTNDRAPTSMVKVEMKTGDFTTMNEFSVSMWIKMKDEYADTPYLFAIGNGDITNAYAFLKVDNDSKMGFRVKNMEEGYYICKAGGLNFNDWHHVCASCNMSGVTLYVDKTIRAYEEFSVDYSNNIKDTFYIGNSDDGGRGENNASAFIQDVQVYNRSLSDEEVNKLYESGRIPKN